MMMNDETMHHYMYKKHVREEKIIHNKYFRVILFANYAIDISYISLASFRSALFLFLHPSVFIAPFLSLSLSLVLSHRTFYDPSLLCQPRRLTWKLSAVSSHRGCVRRSFIARDVTPSTTMTVFYCVGVSTYTTADKCSRQSVINTMRNTSRKVLRIIKRIVG